MKRRFAVIGTVAATAWVFILAGQQAMEPPRPRAKAVVVTPGEFAQIREGMSYQECVRVIGAEGTPFGSSAAPVADEPWPEWISFEWRNSPDSYVMVSFHHGEVERARAFNLK